MNEHDILNKEVGGIKVLDMTAITFLGVVAKKINGISTYSKEGQELIQAIANPSLGKMSNETKIEIIRKLNKLGIEL